MRISILCEDSDINQVRQVASDNNIGSGVLKIPLSKSGKLPATHWYCCLTTNHPENILSLKNLTIMEELGPKSFLQKHNLKIVI